MCAWCYLAVRDDAEAAAAPSFGQPHPIMDPFPAIGLAPVIVTFVALSAQIVKRLDELSGVGDVPKAFRDTRARIPLIQTIVAGIKYPEGKAESSSKEHVDQIVRDCVELLKQLEVILDKVTVKQGDSRWRKGLKAAISFTEEGRAQRIAQALHDHILILSTHNALNAKHEERAGDASARPPTARSPPSGLPAYTEGAYHFMVPFERDHYFIGRRDVLDSIDSLFRQQRRVSIAGMGGVGKSQVAVEYAYRFKEINPQAHVFWVYGGSLARFYQEYKKIAKRLRLPSWDDPEANVLEIVSSWLNETPNQFLMILDNADDINDYWPGKYTSSLKAVQSTTNLSHYLPDDCGNLLITSRDFRIAERIMRTGRPIVLQTFTESEATQLFSSGRESEAALMPRDELIELVHALDCLPLAVSQASFSVHRHGIPLKEYLSSLRDNNPDEFLDTELHDSRRDEQSLNSAFRTWRVSFDRIIAQTPRAAELLCLMAMFDRQNIPRSLLDVPGKGMSLSILQDSHLVAARADPGTFILHRLTQTFVQKHLQRTGELEHWRDVSLSCLKKCYPTEIGVEEWPVCDALAPHVQFAIEATPVSTKGKLDLAHILCWSADFDVERGLFAQALTRAKRSLELYKSLVPADDERLAAAAWLNGRLQFYEARSDEDVRVAEENLQRSLKFSARSSLVHAESAFELAYVFYSQDQKEKCLQMAKESFECWAMDANGGDSSVRTLDNRHDYALQLAMFGQHAEAIFNWQEILRLTPLSNALEKTKVVFIYRSTACIAEFQDDHQVAEDMYEYLVKHCSELYGPDHVHVLDYQLVQAELILRQGRYQIALEIAEAILDRCKTKSEWRITTSCLQLKAECYRRTGQSLLELEARKQCLIISKQKIGPNSKDTCDAMEGVARCLISQNDLLSAAQLCHEVLLWRDSNLGPGHPDTLVALHLSALCKIKQGENSTAESLLKDIINRRPEAMDQSLVQNTCIALWGQSKWSEVVAWCHKGLELDTVDDFEFQTLLLIALRKDGKMEEALALETSLLEIEGKPQEANLDLQTRLPPFDLMRRRRFGRIIHPRTWSS